uniref:Uncharacterized protein n=1 Tax=Salix viminalis TaxID=40686 RepID=A0A6N2NHA4_SALVM
MKCLAKKNSPNQVLKLSYNHFIVAEISKVDTTLRCLISEKGADMPMENLCMDCLMPQHCPDVKIQPALSYKIKY